jgi:hypothetical protein
MVFDPVAAPRERESFMRWYEDQTTWGESHSYDDYRVCSPALQRWFLDMVETFPPMNGPLASKDYDSFVTDHCCGNSVIYSAFAWSVADTARRTMRELAIKHGLGFYDVSGDPGEILFPDDETASNQRLERP